MTPLYMLPVNWDRQNIKKEYHSPNSGLDLLYHTLFYSVTNKKIDWLYISKTKRGMEVRKLIIASILKLEAQGPCTGHRSIIAILYCFSFKYMKRKKGRDLTQYTNLCGLNTLPH